MAQSSANTFASSKQSSDLESAKYGRASPGYYHVRNKYANYGFSNGMYGTKEEHIFDEGKHKMICTLLMMLSIIIIILILVAAFMPEYAPVTLTDITIEDEPKRTN